MTSRGCGVLTLEHFEKKSKMATQINFLSYLRNQTRYRHDWTVILYVSRHEEFDSTIIDMKKCNENKMATISMLQMVVDYAKKDYISCSTNKKHKNMTQLIFHVENYIRSAFREILTFLNNSPLHLHHAGRTCRSHFGRPVHPGMRKMVCMPCQSCCSCILTRWRIWSLCSLPQGMSTMPGMNPFFMLRPNSCTWNISK